MSDFHTIAVGGAAIVLAALVVAALRWLAGWVRQNIADDLREVVKPIVYQMQANGGDSMRDEMNASFADAASERAALHERLDVIATSLNNHLHSSGEYRDDLTAVLVDERTKLYERLERLEGKVFGE